ncbi:pyridoxamine 5'-phosphate oxidase family protein [Bacillus licheniformis]|nr:pyridoxamine 5'-phosphate oxidase family protein [Bacillus licheniformis]OAZ62311.1 uncharacterized protein SRCM100115_03051 [Bacillus licheniformis]
MEQNSKIIQPSILYYGTPVILLSTMNEDGSTNLSPLSSSWALGDSIVLGIGTEGKALENLERHAGCVINVPDSSFMEKCRTAGFLYRQTIRSGRKKAARLYLP